VVAAGCAACSPSRDWPVTGGDPGNTRYSSLDQINRDNVARLRLAWTYHTGDAPRGGPSEIQATPIVVGGVLYTTTPALAVIALRAGSGTLLWRFDPFAQRAGVSHVNRGVVYWAEGRDRRIFFTAGRRLYALNARTGQPIATFGDSGSVDLAAGLGRDVTGAYLVATSPGVVYKDLLIQGTRVGEEEGSAPGDVRAYDVRTGKIRWTFHTIPRPGEYGYTTWPPDAWRTAGGANSWAGMAVDAQQGVVYIPAGSATPDFYGGARTGADLFANALLALDAATGTRRWHFQTVHHDLWDRDLPAAPNLVTVTRQGKRLSAVAQITKSGFVFLFDRGSGTPLFPVEELPVPRSDLLGEHAWPTQPAPIQPAPFARQAVVESMLTRLSPEAHAAALRRFRTLRHESLFSPPSREGTIVLPGFDGGGEWGGAAVDTGTGVLYVNGSDVPWIAAMRPAAMIPQDIVRAQTGPAIYAAACASCHGSDRRGRDRAPSLVNVGARLSPDQLEELLAHGRGFMPSFGRLTARQRCLVTSYLRGTAGPSESCAAGATSVDLVAPQSPYEFVGYERWRDSSGYPAVMPPWGTLSAIDLNSGAYRWSIPLGEHPELGPATGAEQYGGPIVTAGGLVFIAATMDGKFRAFDKTTGHLLWETTLPAAGYATPSTYMIHGKQFVVIAAGGGKLGTTSSDAYLAFALP
jgi:quinoprotein glucose dehydrogenase